MPNHKYELFSLVSFSGLVWTRCACMSISVRYTESLILFLLSSFHEQHEIWGNFESFKNVSYVFPYKLDTYPHQLIPVFTYRCNLKSARKKHSLEPLWWIFVRQFSCLSFYLSLFHFTLLQTSTRFLFSSLSLNTQKWLWGL